MCAMPVQLSPGPGIRLPWCFVHDSIAAACLAAAQVANECLRNDLSMANGFEGAAAPLGKASPLPLIATMVPVAAHHLAIPATPETGSCMSDTTVVSRTEPSDHPRVGLSSGV